MPHYLWILVFAVVSSVSAADNVSPKIDYRALVSRADLLYRAPTGRRVEGQPLGNGRMGTAVWTTPGAIGLQINRGDVFAVNKHHAAGPQYGPTDYCGTSAYVTIDVGGEPFAPGGDFRQRLSLCDAEVTLDAGGVHARCFISAVEDVLVLEIDDQRPQPQPLRVTLNRWRPAKVTTGGHVATLEFADEPEGIMLVQRFREGDYHCASAVAARAVGRPAKVETPDEQSRMLSLPPRSGKTLVLIASAASWEPDAQVADDARRLLDRAAGQSWDELHAAHAGWWSDFWSRTFVHLDSPDGVAEGFANLRNLHLYMMASTSRGPLPTKWNGLLFATEGDTRAWGSQYWVWTTEMQYWPLLAADAVDLSEGFFNMYVRQLPDCRKAARQRWGVPGAFYPETTPFDGPVVLPDDVAREFQDVYLGRKKNTELSELARKRGQFDSSLFVFTEGDLAAGRYTWISHVCSSGAELAVHAWWRYRYSGDEAWLRSHAYPLLRETAEFYRHRVVKGDDGRYHVHGTNAHEDFWGVDDGIMDLAAIRGTVPLAIRAAEVLNGDAELRAAWRELLDNLAPYPLGGDPRSQALTGGALADDVWAAGHRGEVDGHHNPEDVWLNPVFPFEDWTLEARQPATDRIVQKLLDLAPRHASVLGGTGGLNTAIRTPIAAVRAGRGDDLPRILTAYRAAFSPLANGLSLFEGSTAASVEHLGLLSMILQESLLQSVSPRPGEPEVLRVFPAWPKTWSGSFRLLARGGFLVTAALREGQVEFVEVHSRRGETCRLRNPWAEPCTLTEDGGHGRQLAGEILAFDTQAGKTYRVLPHTATAR